MRSPAVLVTLFIALVVTSACGGGGPGAITTSRLAFTAGLEGDGEVYAVNADGSGRVNLSSSPADDRCCPVWSPDGIRIAFVSNRDGNEEIYVVNADGSGLTNLTDNPAPDHQPTWSPDGTRIAFASGRDAKTLPTETPTSLSELYTPGDFGWDQVYVMDAGGSNQTRLTENRSGFAGDRFPAWSPDGTRIAFVSTRELDETIYVMNADGSGQRRLTGSGPGPPVWSPDGTRIAFVGAGIQVINADGSGLATLADGSSPAWSPDGSSIAFARGREVGIGGGTSDIYVMDADGSRESRLTEGEFLAGDGSPTWSPDGTRIAFVRGGAIYAMKANGSNQTRVAEGPALLVVWSPAP